MKSAETTQRIAFFSSFLGFDTLYRPDLVLQIIAGVQRADFCR
jgi:hypothetical protein